jgi:serine/threonine-protein kinase
VSLAVGERLGPYAILDHLGAGGMGEVWRAVDTRLGREAAIKVLPQNDAHDAESLQRFRREAQILAALDHPNIASIYSFESIEGVQVLAMEMVAGETIAQRLREAPLPVPEALEVARRVADALAAAHASGILHRDLKPANVKVTPQGKVKLLDFGLAKVFTMGQKRADISGSPTIDSGDTREGTVIGTFSYMSPEQTRGKPLDGRTDVWSFGCLLFEMLSGKKAFPGETMSDVFAAILGKEPDLSLLPKDTPKHVAALIAGCLVKSLDTRVSGMALAARRLDSADATTMRHPVAPGRPRTLRFAAAAFLVAGAALTWIVLRGRDGRALPASKLLAILPATDLTGRPDGRVLCDGLSASLRVKLQRVPGIQVLAASSPAAARETELAKWARDTGANLLVQPIARQKGDELRLSFSMTRPASPVLLAGDEVTGSANEPFQLEDELAARLLTALDVRTEKTKPKFEVAQGAPQVDTILAMGYLEAWDDPASIQKAIDLLTAIPNGKGSALVQATLGRAYLRSYELSTQTSQAGLAQTAAERAIALEPDLPEALLTLGRLLTATGKPHEALAPIRRALSKNPTSADGELALARALLADGSKAEAEKAFRRAVELRPTSWVIENVLGTFFFGSERYEEAAAAFERAAALDADAPTVQYNLGAALFRLGRLDAAEAAFRRSLAIRGTAVAWSNLGTLLDSRARYPEAVAAFEQAVKLSPEAPSLWMNLGDGLRRVPARSVEARAAYETCIRLARAALSVNPRDAETHATQALALARLGKADAARAEARAALALEPKEPTVLLLAARVAQLGGRSDDALSWIEQALASGLSAREVESEPDFESLRGDTRYKATLARARKEEKEKT